MKIQLTPTQVLEYVIFGIKNGNYQAAIDIAQDCIDQLKAEKKLESPFIEEDEDEKGGESNGQT